MKKILLALSLLLAFPTFAAQSYGSGNINDSFTATLVAVNDQICYNNVNLAAKLATVQWTVTTAGSGGITVQISKDYGTNSIVGTPLSTLNAVGANPSTAPWVNNGPVVGTYETPLPNGATNFCILYQTGGTATTITLSPGKPYTPGSVAATLYDTTSAVNTINSTGVLDLSGWNAYFIGFSAGGATTVALIGTDVADDGFVVEQTAPAGYSAGGGRTLVAAATSGVFTQPRFSITATNQLPPTKRAAFSLAATAAQSTRLRVEAYR